MGKFGAVLIAIGVLAGIGTASADGSARSANGRLVFTAEVGAHTQLFTIEPDGTGLQQITHFTNSDSANANWSPDGQRIAFERDFATHAGVYTINADGGDLKALTPKHWKFESVPSYSPNGKQIVFNRDNGKRDEIWIMSSAGTGRRQITPNNPKGTEDRYEDHPNFSPDGKRIVLVNESDSRTAVFVVNTNGSGFKRLTPYSLGGAGRADWSPDGSTVVFSSGSNGKPANVYTIHPDGSGLAQLTQETDSSINDAAQAWSPDGTQIAFVRYTGTAGDLYVMNADGTGAKQVTTGLAVHGGDWGTHS